MVYWEQMYAELSNFIDNHYWQHYNVLILLQWSQTGANLKHYAILFSIFVYKFELEAYQQMFHNF